MRISFVIAGGQKCGSTFVHHGLMRHPGIRMDPDENTAFFKDDHERRIAEYLSGMDVQRDALVGIKRPDLLHSVTAARRLHNHNPDMRVLIVLRNPFDRVVAGYYHLLMRNHLPLLHVEQGLPAIIDGSMHPMPPRAHTVLRFSTYAESLAAYLDIFSEEQVYIALFDDLKADSQAFMNGIFDFLEVDRIDISALTGYRPNKVVYSLERLKFLRLANPLLMQLDENQIARGRKRALSVEEEAFVQMTKMFDENVMAPRYPNIRPELSAELREAVASVFVPDIRATGRILQTSLQHWIACPDAGEPGAATEQKRTLHTGT